MENNFTLELIEQARQAESPEVILNLAKENGITLTEDEAREYFSELHGQSQKTGELSDDELDNVSGGGCYYKDGRLVVTCGYSCKYYTCKICHGKFTQDHYCPGLAGLDGTKLQNTCGSCEYRTNKGLRMLCNHPDKYKK
ncbi:MAG: Nif11-like leader peptide family RiPP precursor [Oscillospiraceae bacterium]|nr:Nif11-like leader peptide family RiPP precursor [Oscillospiraceae bacterium]